MNELKTFDFEFNLKTKTRFGVGTALNLGTYLKELPFKRIGIIVDSNVSNQKYVIRILENIKKQNFSKVQIRKYNLNVEPDYDSLDKVKADFLEGNLPAVDCFVGIGGGSAMDFAKGLATLVVNPGKAITYRGFPTDINPSLPTIAVPTTAGTASEVTYNAVFIDRQGKKKLGINTHYNFPVLAILDPKLTLSCPKSVTVSSGMDALVHTLESYIAVQANPYTRIFAKEAFRYLFNSIGKVIDDPENIELRSNILFGAYLAGISLMNSGSGVAGALSYSLGVHFNVPHGIAGAVFLPYVMEHNVKMGYDYSELHDLIDGADKSLSPSEKSNLFAEKLFELCKKLDVPDNMRGFGVNENNINILLDENEHLDKAFAQNPLPFSVEDGKRLLIKMIGNQKEEKDKNARI
jgi:alcohol dehydrogenase